METGQAAPRCGARAIWVAHTYKYGYTVFLMKTTLEIQDGLLLRAKRLAKRTGRPLRALVEEGLQLVLMRPTEPSKVYRLPDRSVGDPTAPNPLEHWSWQDLRDEIYGEPGRK